MAELMMVNPRKRRRKVARRKKRTAVRRRNPVAAYTRNPVKRRRVKRRPIARRRTSVKRYKRNPNGNIVQGILMPAAQAAGGALALDVLWGFLPVPINLKTGPMRYLAKGAGALGLLWIGDMVLPRATAKTMATGAMTVIMHDAMREVAQNVMPNVPLDGIGYYSAGWPAGGGVGAYGSDRLSGSDRLNLGGLDAYAEGNIDPYLSRGNLSNTFAGPSPADVAFTEGEVACLETEGRNGMGKWY